MMNLNEETAKMTDEALEKWIIDIERDIQKLKKSIGYDNDDYNEHKATEVRRLRVMQRWIKAVLQSRNER